MGFVSWVSNAGSLGSTTRWAIKQFSSSYDFSKGNESISSIRDCFEIMIERRYQTFPNEEIELYLLDSVKELPGLAGLVIEVLNCEAGLSKNYGSNLREMIKPIFQNLDKTDFSKKIKYGSFKSYDRWYEDENGYPFDWVTWINDFSSRPGYRF